MKKIILIIIILLFSIQIALFIRVLPSIGLDVIENSYKINNLNFSNNIFYRQTLNNCAPYSVMCVIDILKNQKIDPEILAKKTKWRIRKNMTFPQGLINLLHKYDIKTDEYSLKLYNSKEKINWLKNCIDNGKPVILLIKVNNIQHYVTVIGYDQTGFMLYDSLQEKESPDSRKTSVDRKEYAGNRYYKNSELIKLWDKGGYKIFFRNWCVVCY